VTSWCIEHLHRLPCEIHVPTSLLIGGMVAYGTIAKERMEELEAQRERASSGWSG
jgi:hypothetical protein